MDWNMYPRPSLKREGNFLILNDGWTLNGKTIRVPFPPESRLSGYEGEISPSFTYKKDFELPPEALKCLKNKGKLYLYFGAIDQVSSVYVNDQLAGHSELGYFKLSCDITDIAYAVLKENNPKLSVRVEGEDFLDHTKPYGKQKVNRGGMWYTPVSGIWQTVWCEWVPENHISKINYSVKDSKVTFSLCTSASEEKQNLEVKAHLKLSEGNYDFSFSGNIFELDLSKITLQDKKHEVQYWSAENPYLYSITFEFEDDRVESYFAVRTVNIQTIDGYKRICVNGKPVFLNGVLDQGYFEDGLFTPESPEEYKKDILRMKELGFNTLRKHIKVEPELFYYFCDSLGMYLVQDMINNGPYSFFKDTLLPTLGFKLNDKNRYKNEEQKQWFKLSAFETQNFLHNNPSVIMYTVFNEGWGQTDSDEIGDELKEKDPSRIYDYTSGWFKQKNSDLDSLHIYFRTKNLKAGQKPLFLSEFGGFSREVHGHIWNPEKSYGYGKCNDEKDLTDRIIKVYEKMIVPGISKGLCGSIYTQLSDIEDEINGFYTYDRQICKVDKERLSSFMKSMI